MGQLLWDVNWLLYDEFFESLTKAFLVNTSCSCLYIVGKEKGWIKETQPQQSLG